MSGNAALPASTTEKMVKYELREGNVVRATGASPVTRLPDSTGQPGAPFVHVWSGFEVTGLSGSGEIVIRLLDPLPAVSAPLRYSWTCLHSAPASRTSPGVVPLPDLTYAPDLLDLSMYRPAGGGTSDRFRVRPGGSVLLWDTRACRGQNTGWSMVNLRIVFLQAGTGPRPPRFTVLARVPRAPQLEGNVNDMHLEEPGTLRFLSTQVSAARAASGGDLDVILRKEIDGRVLNGPGSRLPYGQLDIALPCGPDRTLELVIDPDNAVQESDEGNNRLLLHYDLLG